VVTTPPQDAAPSEDDAAVPISAHNPTWGSRTASVTIVEFADFECPYSLRVQQTLRALREKYGPETLRIVWKNNPLPFHKHARPASIAAMGVLELAGLDPFWKFHDSLFGNQTTLSDENFERWAGEAGLKQIEAFRVGLASGRWADPVDADLRDGKSLGVPGTPHFFVNGVSLSGAQPLDKFTAVIDEELDKAKARYHAGTPKVRLYAETARFNRANAPKPAEEKDPPREDNTTVFKIPLGRSPGRGRSTALVTIVEFADFQCPFCGRVQATLAAIRTKYGDKVRIVWKNLPLPFHPNAMPAAEAALEVRAEAGDAAFWSMHDLLFAGQSSLTADAIAAMATKVGASAAAVRAAMNGHTHRREIQADEDLAEDFSVQGTPNFFINGRHLVGAQPQDTFDKMIDEEIAKVQGLLASKTPPSDIYLAVTKDGKGPLPPETKDLPASVPAGDPARGNAHAKVTLHEWADFQCPFCGRVEPTVADLLKDYGTRVKFVWHDLPLPMHPDAQLAAQAAREAFRQKGAAGFWSMHDKLFANQANLKRADLDGYAGALGLDIGTWTSALDGATHASEVEVDAKAAGTAGISGTPAFLIVAGTSSRGYFISGAQSAAKFRKLIDRALAEAR
jgi:protein-disulfide isomerase